MTEYTDLIEALVPLLESILYVGALIFLLWRFRDDAQMLMDALKRRISGGASLSFGMVSIGAEPAQSQVTSTEVDEVILSEPSEEVRTFQELRDSEYRRTRGLYIYHAIRPTREVGQKYSVDIFIGVHPRVAQKTNTSISDISSARFFLGPFWKNEVFVAQRFDEGYGFTTNAFGEFLVAGEVCMNDGSIIHLFRYVDFKGTEISLLNSRP